MDKMKIKELVNMLPDSTLLNVLDPNGKCIFICWNYERESLHKFNDVLQMNLINILEVSDGFLKVLVSL